MRPHPMPPLLDVVEVEDTTELDSIAGPLLIVFTAALVTLLLLLLGVVVVVVVVVVV
jgi:hypothetical protein